MAPRIILTGTTGKIGGAVLRAIISYDLAKPSDLVVATSSKPGDPRLKPIASLGVEVRHSNYDSIEMMVAAFAGCERLFLVSTAQIDLDFHDCAKGGRETHHFNALEAAKQAGISHVYYTSLAFQAPSKAAVMRAHLRTEEFLRSQHDYRFTIIREGIYSESWPLYLGHFTLPEDQRDDIVTGSDGPISWTSIPDLGLANALIVTGDDQQWSGKTFWLSNPKTLTIADVAALVAQFRSRPLEVKAKSQDEYVRYYTEERGMDKGYIEWWSSTYPALQDHECSIKESPLEQLLASKGQAPTPMEQTLREMLMNV